MALANRQHELFAQDYATHGNSRRAAITVGLHPGSGPRIMAKPEVRARVDQLADEQFTQANVNAARVLKELSRIAFLDLRGLYDEYGNLLPVHDLDDDTAAVISQIKVEVQGRGAGEDREMVVVKTIKAADKMAALGLLARHFKIVGDVDEGMDAFANALADRLNSAKRRENANRDAQDARIVDRAAGGGVSLTYGVPDDPSDARDVTNRRLQLGRTDPEALHFDLPDPVEVPAAAKVAATPPAGGFQVQPAGAFRAHPAPSPSGDSDEIW